MSQSSQHYMRCRRRFDGVIEWTGVSWWDVQDGRLRREMSRRTFYTDERAARRWARRYKVDFPTEPEPPRVRPARPQEKDAGGAQSS